MFQGFQAWFGEVIFDIKENLRCSFDWLLLESLQHMSIKNVIYGNVHQLTVARWKLAPFSFTKKNKQTKPNR